MKALVINETRSHYGFVIDVEEKVDGSYYDGITDLVYEARELQFQKQDCNIDWSTFRREAAKDIVCAILSAGMEQTDDNNEYFHTFENLAKTAVSWADELIRQLKKE